MKTTRLLLVYAALILCNPAFADPIGYTETFDSGSNMDWGTDYGSSWDTLFGSNYNENGAQYSSTGGYTGGYVFQDAAGFNLNLVFADSNASSGALAGNKNYSTFPRLEAYVTAAGDYIDSWVDLFFCEYRRLKHKPGWSCQPQCLRHPKAAMDNRIRSLDSHHRRPDESQPMDSGTGGRRTGRLRSPMLTSSAWCLMWR